MSLCCARLLGMALFPIFWLACSSSGGTFASLLQPKEKGANDSTTQLRCLTVQKSGICTTRLIITGIPIYFPCPTCFSVLDSYRISYIFSFIHSCFLSFFLLFIHAMYYMCDIWRAMTHPGKLKCGLQDIYLSGWFLQHIYFISCFWLYDFAPTMSTMEKIKTLL